MHGCRVLAVLQRFLEAFGGDLYRPMVPLNEASEPVFADGLASLPGFGLGLSLLPMCRAALAHISLPSMPPWAYTFLTAQKPMLVRVCDLDRPDVEWVTQSVRPPSST